MSSEIRSALRRRDKGLGARGGQLAALAKERVPGWRRKAATVAAGGLALVMAYGVMFGHNGLTAFAHKRRETVDLQQQMLRLQAENDRLHGHVERLKSDPGAIEHEAREDLHLARPGEVIVTMPAKPAAPQQSPPE